jgi:hypothetical protein
VKATGAILVICCSIAASAQVKISVSEPSYRSHDKIDVEVSNTGSSNVKFCVDYGYVSSIDLDHTEGTPTPVYVQQEVTRGWSTLLTGPDIGSAQHLETLERGQSQHYPFRVNANGTVRLVIDYWLGSEGHQCGDTKGRRTAFSHKFKIE